MRARVAALVAVVVLVAAGAGSYLFFSGRTSPQLTSVVPSAPFFDKTGAIVPGPFAAAYSADGSRLAVRSSEGVGLATRGRVSLLTPRGSNVVEFAWMTGPDRLLVAEGPISTGQLAALRLDGKVDGIVKLQPSFSVGTGYGMAVDSTARHAVLTKVDLDPLTGIQHLDLVEVDLQSGAVRDLTTTPEVQESAPFYIDDQHVLYQRQDGTRAAVAVLDTVDRRSRDLTGEAVTARPVGVLLDGTYVAYVT